MRGIHPQQQQKMNQIEIDSLKNRDSLKEKHTSSTLEDEEESKFEERNEKLITKLPPQQDHDESQLKLFLV